MGQAVAHMTYQAMSEEIFLHQMGGFDKVYIRKVFNVPEDITIVTVIALGYLGNSDKLPDDLKKMELKLRERKPIKELLLDSLI